MNLPALLVQLSSQSESRGWYVGRPIAKQPNDAKPHARRKKKEKKKKKKRKDLQCCHVQTLTPLQCACSRASPSHDLEINRNAEQGNPIEPAAHRKGHGS
ncbi:hypothetical protein LZ31DRAFT_187800 [Colletotrichum somersetense]|nr:hypothetical protein LZ31DRAFT_187800 [Colletotrichum somersetense]